MDARDILKKHKNFNFVKRLMDPNIYPNIDNKDGSISTHKMAYGEEDGKYYVYPTIVQKDDGKLVELDGKAAWEHARKTKERIEFDNEKEASDFASGGYKKGTQWDESYDKAIF